MNRSQREEVLANAKYLQHVRPIDPEEIQEYITGRPHPAAIRQVLREEAPNLAMIERENGTFEPVPEEPIHRAPGIVDQFPEHYSKRLSELLVDKFGPKWYSDESGALLRNAIRRLKQGYFEGASISYDEATAMGYAIYHLPDFYAAIQYVLEDLIERQLLPRHLRVVDVGAGTGGPALGLIDALPTNALLEYHAIEPSSAASVLEALLSETGPNVHATIHRNDAQAVTPPPCDLLVFANVLSELEKPVTVLKRYVEALADDGTLLLLAPADYETSTALREYERSIASEANMSVFSPTVRLWPEYEPADQCWSFDVRPDLGVPPFQRRLDEYGEDDGEFHNVDVQFSYALLRPDGKQRIEFSPDPGRFARMADTDDHVTERIDLPGVKLSHDLADDGNPLFLIGDGSQQVDHFAVLGRETRLNDAILGAEYGDLLLFESVLVLWNDDEGAFNLVIDEQTVVNQIAP